MDPAPGAFSVHVSPLISIAMPPRAILQLLFTWQVVFVARFVVDVLLKPGSNYWSSLYLHRFLAALGNKCTFSTEVGYLGGPQSKIILLTNELQLVLVSLCC